METDDDIILCDHTYSVIDKFIGDKNKTMRDIPNEKLNILSIFLEHQLNILLVSKASRRAFLTNPRIIYEYSYVLEIMLPTNVKCAQLGSNLLYYNTDLVTDQDLDSLRDRTNIDYETNLGTILGYHKPWVYPNYEKSKCVVFNYTVLYPILNGSLTCQLYTECSDSDDDEVVLSAFKKHKGFENCISKIFEGSKNQLTIRTNTVDAAVRPVIQSND